MLQGVFCEQRDNLTPVPSLSGSKALSCYFCRMSGERLLPKSSHCLESASWDKHRGYLGFDFHWHLSGTGCPSAHLQSFQRGAGLLLPGETHTCPACLNHYGPVRGACGSVGEEAIIGGDGWWSWEQNPAMQKHPSIHDKESPATKASP